MQVCGVLMAVDWGKAGRFGCFFTVCCDFGLLWRLRLCDSALVSRRVWRIDLQKFCLFLYLCTCQCVCVRQNEFFIVVFCVMAVVWCGELIVKKRSFWLVLCRRGTRYHKGA